MTGRASGGGVFFYRDADNPSTGYFRLYGTDGRFYHMNFTANPGKPAKHTNWVVAD